MPLEISSAANISSRVKDIVHEQRTDNVGRKAKSLMVPTTLVEQRKPNNLEYLAKLTLIHSTKPFTVVLRRRRVSIPPYVYIDLTTSPIKDNTHPDESAIHRSIIMLEGKKPMVGLEEEKLRSGVERLTNTRAAKKDLEFFKKILDFAEQQLKAEREMEHANADMISEGSPVDPY